VNTSLNHLPYVSGFQNVREHPRMPRVALAWRRTGIQVPSGPLSFSVDLQVKREEQEKAPACSRALVQQPSGITGSCSQSQTSFTPKSLRVHALLRRVRACEPRRCVRLRASHSRLGAGLSVPYTLAIILTDDAELLMNTALGRLSHHSSCRISI
jgi:hypothetical protein